MRFITEHAFSWGLFLSNGCRSPYEILAERIVRRSGRLSLRCRSPYEIPINTDAFGFVSFIRLPFSLWDSPLYTIKCIVKQFSCRSPYEILIVDSMTELKEVISCRSPYEILCKVTKAVLLDVDGLPFSLWDSSAPIVTVAVPPSLMLPFSLWDSRIL